MEKVYPIIVFFILIFFRVRIAYALLSVSLIFPLLQISENFFFYRIIVLNILKVFENDLMVTIPFFVYFGVLIKNSNLGNDFLKFLDSFKIKSLDTIFLSLFSIIVGMSVSIAGSALVIFKQITDFFKDRKSKKIRIMMVAAFGTLSQLMPPALSLIILYNASYGVIAGYTKNFFTNDKISILDFYYEISFFSIFLVLVYLFYFLYIQNNKVKKKKLEKYKIIKVLFFFFIIFDLSNFNFYWNSSSTILNSFIMYDCFNFSNLF